MLKQNPFVDVRPAAANFAQIIITVYKTLENAGAGIAPREVVACLIY